MVRAVTQLSSCNNDLHTWNQKNQHSVQINLYSSSTLNTLTSSFTKKIKNTRNSWAVMVGYFAQNPFFGTQRGSRAHRALGRRSGWSPALPRWPPHTRICRRRPRGPARSAAPGLLQTKGQSSIKHSPSSPHHIPPETWASKFMNGQHLVWIISSWRFLFPGYFFSRQIVGVQPCSYWNVRKQQLIPHKGKSCCNNM